MTNERIKVDLKITVTLGEKLDIDRLRLRNIDGKQMMFVAQVQNCPKGRSAGQSRKHDLPKSSSHSGNMTDLKAA
jgi:hypothetical protein